MGTANKETKLTVLNEHYKETNQAIAANVKSRDRNFFYLLFLLGVMASQLFAPQKSNMLLTQIAQKRLGTDVVVGANYISSILWFGLLAIAIRYFQTVINLKKQYNYVHRLEEELAKDYDGKVFTRESQSYLEKYPIFSSWLHVLYRGIFPLLLAVAMTIKIVGEWHLKNAANLPRLLDSAIYIMLLVSIALYAYSLSKMHKDKEVRGKVS